MNASITVLKNSTKLIVTTIYNHTMLTVKCWQQNE